MDLKRNKTNSPTLENREAEARIKKLQLEQKAIKQQLSVGYWVLESLKVLAGAAAVVALFISFVQWQGNINRERSIRDETRFESALEKLTGDAANERIAGVALLSLFLNNQGSEWHPQILLSLTYSLASEPDPVVRGGAIFEAFRNINDETVSKELLSEVLSALASMGRTVVKEGSKDVGADIARVMSVVASKGNFSFSGIYCPGCDFVGVDFRQANLSGANLSNADLDGAVLIDANLTEANLSNAHLKFADLTEANISRADLTEASLNDAILYGAFLGNTNFTNANLSRANLDDSILPNANFSNAILIETKLFSAGLDNAILSNANLSGAILDSAALFKADLSGANLSKANLSFAVLTDANLADAILIGADLTETDVTVQQLRSAKSFEGAILPSSVTQFMDSVTSGGGETGGEGITDEGVSEGQD